MSPFVCFRKKENIKLNHKENSLSPFTSLGFTADKMRASYLHYKGARAINFVILMEYVFLKGGKEPRLFATHSVEGLTARNNMEELSNN